MIWNTILGRDKNSNRRCFSPFGDFIEKSFKERQIYSIEHCLDFELSNTLYVKKRKFVKLVKPFDYEIKEWTKVTMLDNGIFIAVSTGGKIMKSSDNCKTWQSVHTHFDNDCVCIKKRRFVKL